MGATLGTLLDRLQGLLSKGFLLAGFLPVVILLCLNAGLSYWVFPQARSPISSFFKLAPGDQVLYWLAGLLLSFVLGIVFWSLNPWFRQFLEGRYLPASIYGKMMKWQSEKLRELVSKRLALGKDRQRFGRANKESPTWKAALRAARIEGSKLSPAASPVDANLINEFNRLQKLQQQWEQIAFDDMNNLFAKLEGELKSKSANTIKPLDELHTGFLNLLDYASKRIDSDYSRAWAEKTLRFPEELGRLGPTSIANLAEVHREYGLQRYGLDIELFWIRMLKIVQADTGFYPIIEEAKTQLDFSVAMTALLALVTLVWSPLSLFAPDIYPYLIVVGFGPLATLIFYSVVVQNYRGFAEAVRSAVDLHRFELLQALHIELPGDSKKEKEKWQQLMNMSSPGSQEVIVYKHESQKDSAKPEQAHKETLWDKLRKLVGGK